MVRKEMKNFQETYVDFLIDNIWLIVVMCQGMTNPHVPLSCPKNPSDLEGDDISSLLTKLTTGKIEAFSTYLRMNAANS